MILAWAANITSCIALLLMTRKVWWAPIFGAAQQILWAYWCIQDRLWPLLLTTAVWFVAYAVAVPKWYNERAKDGYKDKERKVPESSRRL